ncbi:MAG: hypothetical protein V4538_01560 [Bacteroidota bacterium]
MLNTIIDHAKLVILQENTFDLIIKFTTTSKGVDTHKRENYSLKDANQEWLVGLLKEQETVLLTPYKPENQYATCTIYAANTKGIEMWGNPFLVSTVFAQSFSFD